jgi:pimeloyl-ACP methyl ester carboxylesterase
MNVLTLQTPEVRLSAAVEGEGPLVVLVHGFPEGWRSWRRLMTPIAAAGYRACAIDVRGYGGSDKPQAVEAYRMEALTADVAGVITALSPDAPAVIIGHDWGAPIVWNTALAHPALVRAVGGLSIPYLGPPDRPFTEVIKARYTDRDRFFYQAYFQAEGVAEAEAEADVEGFLKRFFFAASGEAPPGAFLADKPAGANLLDGMPDPDALPAWLTAEDLADYAQAFRRSGLRGPLNRYRNHERDFHWMRGLAKTVIEQPALFIAGSRDPVIDMVGGLGALDVMRRHVADLRVIEILEGCGHWTQQERPAEVERLVIDWLGGLQ